MRQKLQKVTFRITTVEIVTVEVVDQKLFRKAWERYAPGHVVKGKQPGYRKFAYAIARQDKVPEGVTVTKASTEKVSSRHQYE